MQVSSVLWEPRILWERGRPVSVELWWAGGSDGTGGRGGRRWGQALPRSRRPLAPGVGSSGRSQGRAGSVSAGRRSWAHRWAGGQGTGGGQGWGTGLGPARHQGAHQPLEVAGRPLEQVLEAPLGFPAVAMPAQP